MTFVSLLVQTVTSSHHVIDLMRRRLNPSLCWTVEQRGYPVAT